MANSTLPAFKPSGNGLNVDLINIKKAEMISEGWYKGQLIKYLESVAGTKMVDGVLCYNTNISIGQYTNYADKSTRASDVQGLLKLFGIVDDKLTEIYTTYQNSQVQDVQLHFNKNSDYDREYTEFDFTAVWNNIMTALDGVSKVELYHTNKRYSTRETIRTAIASSDIYTGSAWVIDSDYFNELQEYQTRYTDDETIVTAIPIERDFSIGQAMHFSSIKLYDGNNVEITSKFTRSLLNAIKCLLVISGDSFIERTSVEKLGETIAHEEQGENTYSYYIVSAKESYAVNFRYDFVDTQFSRYEHGTLQVYQEDYGSNEVATYSINGILANHLWSYYLLMDSFDNDKSNDLFYISKRTYGVFGTPFYSEDDAVRYISVEGLKNTQAKQVASYLAQYTDFQIIQKKKKRSFLGIGGFIGNFLGGIFEAIIKIIGVVASVLNYIPIFRLHSQVIYWMFSGGKWTNDKKKLDMVATRMLVAIIGVIIIVLTGGSGWYLAAQIMASVAMSAYGMYTGIKDYNEALKQMADSNKVSLADQEAVKEILDLDENGLSKDIDIYNFETHEKISRIYTSPFDKDGLYNPVLNAG